MKLGIVKAKFMNKKIFAIIIVIIVIAAASAAALIFTKKEALAPILDPPASKDDLIRVDAPRPNQAIQNPLVSHRNVRL